MYTSLVLLLLAKMAYTAGATKLLCKTSTCQHHALPLHPQINFGFFISIWFCQRFHRFAGLVVQDFIHTLDLWLKTPPPSPPPTSSAGNPELAENPSPGSWGPGPRPSGRLMQLCSAPSSLPSTPLSSGSLWLHTHTHSESHSITHMHI